MKRKIQNYLKKIETEKQIKILFACESGSRAWGFHSFDSDYDVRFIYIRKLNDYLSINEKRDVLDQCDGLNLTDNIDPSGWDLKKTLLLLKKSNPVLSEWLRSPIIYRNPFSFRRQLRKLNDEFFSPKAGICHYLSMAERNFRSYLKNEQVPLKKYFYVLRPILCCLHIEKLQSPPPMQFVELMGEFKNDLGSKINASIKELLNIKMRSEEISLGPRIDILNKFIEKHLAYFENLDNSLEPAHCEYDKLDHFFRTTLFRFEKY